MIIPQELIDKAKDKMGDKSAFIIAEALNLEDFDDKNLKARCPFHNEKTPSFVYNTKHNHWHCFGCNRNFGIIDLYMQQGFTYLGAVEKLFEETGIKFKFGERNVKTKREYKYPKLEDNNDRTKVEQYLAERKISKQTLDYCDIREDHSGNVVFNYYDTNDVLTMVKYRPARRLKHGETKTWCQKDADTTPLLFNMNRIDPSQPLLITEGECFPKGTEILTPEGWIRLEEYNNQEVMQVDENLNGSFVKPIAYIKKEYRDKLFSASLGNNYKFTTTPDHNIIYIKKGKIHKKPMQDMPNETKWKIPLSIQYNGVGCGYSLEEIALFVAISADGHIRNKKNGDIAVAIRIKKQRKIERLEHILKTNNINYSKTISPSMPDCSYFYFIAPQWIKSKTYPVEWISTMTIQEKKFLINELQYWDGYAHKDCNVLEYASKLYENVLFVQTLAHICGYSCTIYEKTKGKHKWYSINILTSKNSVTWRSMKNTKEETNYDGFVYCVNVPTGMILVRQNEKIFVCGNCDCLAAIESGYKNTVSVPLGAGNMHWIEENWDWLEQFTKIIIWSDADDAGKKMKKDAICRLGEWRCYEVEAPTEIEKDDKLISIKDINEVLYYYGKEKVLECLDNAKEIPITNIIDMYDVQEFDMENSEGVYSGFEALDSWIYKFFFGCLNIITGLNGGGKSVLLNQMCVCEPLNQGYDIFLFSGEMTKPQLKSWIELNLAGRRNVKVENKHIKKIPLEIRKQMQEWYKGRIHIYDNDKDYTATSILNKMEELARKKGVKIFMIDNLMMVDLECNQENIWQKQKEFVVKLVNFANKFNVLVHLVAHPKKIEAIRRLTKLDVGGSGDITNLAHYVMAIHRVTNKEKEGIKNKKGDGYVVQPIEFDCILDLFKNRITGTQDKEMGLYFDNPSYRFYTDTKSLDKVYKWDKNVYKDKLPDPRDENKPEFMKGD